MNARPNGKLGMYSFLQFKQLCPYNICNLGLNTQNKTFTVYSKHYICIYIYHRIY